MSQRSEPEHGTRGRYFRGCACFPCRLANARYNQGRVEAIRAGRWDGLLIDATEAREHLWWLSRQNVGLRAVAEQTGMYRSSLAKVRTGQTKRIRQRHADAILAVSTRARRDAALVDATETWRLVEEMEASGLAAAAVARALGHQNAVQLSRGQVLVRNERAVRNLHDRLWWTRAELRLVCRCPM